MPVTGVVNTNVGMLASFRFFNVSAACIYNLT
jgi:hypothetical protein